MNISSISQQDALFIHHTESEMNKNFIIQVCKNKINSLLIMLIARKLILNLLTCCNTILLDNGTYIFLFAFQKQWSQEYVLNQLVLALVLRIALETIPVRWTKNAAAMDVVILARRRLEQVCLLCKNIVVFLLPKNHLKIYHQRINYSKWFPISFSNCFRLVLIDGLIFCMVKRTSIKLYALIWVYLHYP
jgi:hypothetical protein